MRGGKLWRFVTKFMLGFSILGLLLGVGFALDHDPAAVQIIVTSFILLCMSVLPVRQNEEKKGG